MANNRKIARLAEALAELLDERQDLENRSGFYSDTHFNILQIIGDASRHNGHFNGWVREPLAKMRGRFDMKYWPSLSACLRVIAEDAEDAEIRASNETTEVATAGSRKADAGYFRALDGRFKDESKPDGEFLPEGFTLSNRAMASVANVVLKRDPRKLFTDEFVKNVRHRARKAAAAQG